MKITWYGTISEVRNPGDNYTFGLGQTGDHILFVTFKGTDYSQLSKVGTQIIPNFQGDRLFPTCKGADYSQLSKVGPQIIPNFQRGCTDYVKLSKLGPQIIPNFLQNGGVGGTYYFQLLGEGVCRLGRSQ